MGDDLALYDNMEKRYEDMVTTCDKIRAILAELKSSYEECENNFQEEEEEEEHQIQESNFLSNQDSCKCIMGVDVKKSVSTSQEESLTTMSNDETIISTIGVGAENPISTSQEESFTTTSNGDTIISTIDRFNQSKKLKMLILFIFLPIHTMRLFPLFLKKTSRL